MVLCFLESLESFSRTANVLFKQKNKDAISCESTKSGLSAENDMLTTNQHYIWGADDESIEILVPRSIWCSSNGLWKKGHTWEKSSTESP